MKICIFFCIFLFYLKSLTKYVDLPFGLPLLVELAVLGHARHILVVVGSRDHVLGEGDRAHRAVLVHERVRVDERYGARHVAAAVVAPAARRHGDRLRHLIATGPTPLAATTTTTTTTATVRLPLGHIRAVGCVEAALALH